MNSKGVRQVNNENILILKITALVGKHNFLVFGKDNPGSFESLESTLPIFNATRILIGRCLCHVLMMI